MAADVTLIALPDRSLGPWTGREVMEYRTYQRLFDDDGVWFDDNLEVGDVEAGAGRRRLDDWFFRYGAQPFDFVEIGPWSPLKAAFGLEDNYGGHHFIPEMQAAVFEYWGDGRVVTPATIITTMTLMNRPDSGSIYRRWGKRGTGRGKRRWRSGRRARPRVVKRWLTGHVGDIVWAESW